MGAAHLIDSDETPERLFSRCLFCRAGFPPNALFGRVPPGDRLAFDPDRFRVWSICRRCSRWNLTPLDERYDAVDTLEMAVRSRAVLLASTDNIALYEVEDLTILRIGGAAPVVERATWRFGGEILARAATYHRRTTRIAALAAGAIARVGESLGMLQLDRHWGPSGTADILRWSRFGSVVWDGRTACAHCRSVLHTLHFDASWWLYPRIEAGRLVIGVPCTRCDPWSYHNVFDVSGDDALLLLRRSLAYQNIDGGADRDVGNALHLIRDAGSADRLIDDLATGRSSLWRMGRMRTLALEMSLTHLAERRQLLLELHGIESEWRAEEEIASIIDDDLS
ncbi:hypothetical protein BH23GEM9_BH23GEM9_12800 [soil metagenome]